MSDVSVEPRLDRLDSRAHFRVLCASARDVEFTADEPGEWVVHCHQSHHAMNAMSHEVPNTLGVDQRGLEETIRALLPGYMAMGERGMGARRASSSGWTGTADARRRAPRGGFATGSTSS